MCIVVEVAFSSSITFLYRSVESLKHDLPLQDKRDCESVLFEQIFVI